MTKRAALAAAVFAAAVCTLGCGDRGDATAVGATSSAITGGAPASDDQVVLVDFDDGNRCTGVLVHERAVVTAAHCGVHAPAASMHVRAFSTAGEASARVKMIAIHPAFDRDSLAADLAVLVLDEPIANIAVAELYDGKKAALAPGASVRVVGFGRDAKADGAQSVARLGGVARVDRVEDDKFRIVPGPALTCGGDSGGPAFVELDGKRYVAGITSYGDADCAIDGYDVRIDRHLEGFLRPVIARIAAGTAIDPPRPRGTTCATDGECEGFLCAGAEGAAAKTCTSECDGPEDSTCGGGRRCAYAGRTEILYACVEGTAAAVPGEPASPARARAAAPDEAPASCAASSVGARGSSWTWIVAFAALQAWARRRRSAFRPEDRHLEGEIT